MRKLVRGNQKIEAEVIQHLKDGWTNKRILRHYKTSTIAISRLRKEAGLMHKRRPVKERLRDLREYMGKGYTRAEAAELTGICDAYAQKILTLEVVSVKPKKEASKEQRCKCPRCKKVYFRKIDPESPEYSGSGTWWRYCTDDATGRARCSVSVGSVRDMTRDTQILHGVRI